MCFKPVWRALRVDLSRAIWGRWFLVAVLTTLVSLWLAVSQQISYVPDMLMYSDEPHWAGMLVEAMRGSFAALSLPALSALPAAGQALVEIQTGAARSAIFRSGWWPYILSKTVSVLLCGMLVQAVAILLLVMYLQGIRLFTLGALIPIGDMKEALSPAMARVLCGGIWAGTGSLLALLSQTGSAATVGPLCLCYALMMVGTRFFPGVAVVNPLNWLTAFAPWQALLLIALGLGLGFFHRREVARHV